MIAKVKKGCIINTERNHREQLWKKGVVRASRMTSWKVSWTCGGTERGSRMYYMFIFFTSFYCCVQLSSGVFVCLQHTRMTLWMQPRSAVSSVSLYHGRDRKLVLCGRWKFAERDSVLKDRRVRSSIGFRFNRIPIASQRGNSLLDKECKVGWLNFIHVFISVKQTEISQNQFSSFNTLVSN